MSKPRASTIQQRFGFMDSDLKTPKHDEMMIWLDDNIVDVILSFRTKKIPSEWPDEAEVNLRAKLNSCIDKELKRLKYRSERWNESQDELNDFLEWSKSFSLGPIPSRPPISKQIRTKMEVPVISKSNSRHSSKYIIGFIDLVATVTPVELKIKGMRWLPPGSDYSDEKLLYWPDIRWDIYYKLHDAVRLNFEVKTEIKSLGELLRQIRMYQEYTDGPFVVVCPDDKYQKQINQQGITFYKYEI